MNEVSNFCNGQGVAQTCAMPTDPNADCPDGCCIVCKQVDSRNSLDYPPYNINNDYGVLGIKTLSMAATQFDNITYYDAHNLYGISEQIATRRALLEATGKRPFVLSRSSFLSTGVHSAKWTGDNGKLRFLAMHLA
jgi:alpha-D-xyloside xylohydrolase